MIRSVLLASLCSALVLGPMPAAAQLNGAVAQRSASSVAATCPSQVVYEGYLYTFSYDEPMFNSCCYDLAELPDDGDTPVPAVTVIYEGPDLYLLRNPAGCVR